MSVLIGGTSERCSQKVTDHVRSLRVRNIMLQEALRSIRTEMISRESNCLGLKWYAAGSTYFVRDKILSEIDVALGGD